MPTYTLTDGTRVDLPLSWWSHQTEFDDFLYLDPDGGIVTLTLLLHERPDEDEPELLCSMTLDVDDAKALAQALLRWAA